MSDRNAGSALEETLDPEDWSGTRALAHEAVDAAVDYLRDVRERPAWRAMPADVRAAFEAPAPRGPTPLSEVYREVAEPVMPYPMGNIHPRFWAWYMGSSNFTGALGDFSGRGPGLQPWRRQPRRRHGRRTGRQLVQADGRLSRPRRAARWSAAARWRT